MAEKQETHADIIAWLRRPREGENAYLTLWRDEIADRLEAALRREVATAEKSSAVGDAAKLRNAVKCLMDNLNIHLMQPTELITVNRAELDGMVMVCEKALAATPSQVPSVPSNAAKLREAMITIRDKAHEQYVNDNGIDTVWIQDVANAALAAPPRNCDVYTADELKVIFNSELVLELPIANEHEKNLVTITAMGVIDTLFATTQEGGAK